MKKTEKVEVKQEIVLNDKEKKMIEERRNIGEIIVKHEHLKDLVMLTDTATDTIDGLMGKIDTLVYNCIIAKNMVEKSMVDITKESTEDKFTDGRPMSIMDLKIRNINLKNQIFNYCSEIRKGLTMLITELRVKNVEGQEIMSIEEHEQYFNEVKSTLASYRINLMQNRINLNRK